MVLGWVAGLHREILFTAQKEVFPQPDSHIQTPRMLDGLDTWSILRLRPPLLVAQYVTNDIAMGDREGLVVWADGARVANH